jgi:hypothetical protein
LPPLLSLYGASETWLWRIPVREKNSDAVRKRSLCEASSAIRLCANLSV